MSDRSPLVAWRTLDFPADWDAAFGFGGPLELEVGFGDGRFTVRRAATAPSTRFVGLEVSSGSLQRALKRIKRQGLDNVLIAKVGAEFALRELFAAGSLGGIVVNFPDPWPKERHVKHRLLKRSFYELAATRLVPSGEIRLATDHEEYRDFATEQAAASGLYQATWPEPPEAVFETKYALKWRDLGKPLYYVVFTRNDSHAEPVPHLERPREMPHALLTGALPATSALSKTVLRYGGGHVVLHEAAAVMPRGSVPPEISGLVDERALRDERTEASPDGRTRWLVRATIEEPDLKQQLLIMVQQRQADEVIVRLETFGDPIITEAARGAVHAVTEWLLANTDLSIKRRSY
jgi:tRNA (guanine-N7-)-methyltransferase